MVVPTMFEVVGPDPCQYISYVLSTMETEAPKNRSRPSPLSDVTHTAFCRKICHADRLCPWLFTPRILSSSDRISTMGATSCSMMYRTARCHNWITSEQSLQHRFGTQHEPLHNHRQFAHPTYTYVCMNGGERGGAKGQRGSDSPATRARSSWPTHTPPRVGLARSHTALC